MLGGFPGF